MHPDGRCCLGVLQGLALLVIAPGAIAAPWDFGAVINLSLIHSDNIRLQNDAEKQPDNALLLMPEITMQTDGDRLTANISYRPEAYFYSDNSSANAVFHSLDATLTTALIRDALFVDLSAVNYQTILSAEQRIPTSNLPITANRAESTTLEVRPYWEQDLGFASVLLEVAYADTDYSVDEPALTGFIRDNVGKRGRFSLNNHALQEGVAWGLDYQYRRMEYDEAVPWDFQQASANLGYWFNGTVRVFGVGGKESSFKDYLDPKLADNFWEAGFEYTPNERVTLELAGGDRSFGSTYRGNLSVTTRRGQTSLSYSETPTTRGELGGGRHPLLFNDNLDAYLDRPDATDRFLRRRAELLTTVDLAKSNWSIRIFSEDRGQRTTNTGDPLGSERHVGGAFRFNWSLGSRTLLGLELDGARVNTYTDEGEPAEGNVRRGSLSLGYDFSERLGVTVAAQRATEDGTGGAARNYTENQYKLTLRFTLL